MTKKLFQKMKAKYDEALELTLTHLDNDKRLTRLQRKVKKRKAIKLTEVYFSIDYNKAIDLKQMIQEDILSRKLRDTLPKCKCDKNNKYCFCYNYEKKCFIK
jgi:hypothetical protein